MKKLLLSSAFVFGLASVISAQSLVVLLKGTSTNITGTTINVDSVINGDPYQAMVCNTVDVKNVGSSTMTVRCSRNVVSAIPGSENSFCWGSGCYSTATNTSPILQSPDIAPGAMSSTFVGDYKPSLNPGATTITYRYYDNANPSDYAEVTVVYNATASGIEESGKADGSISNAYPNPASSLVSVKYDMNQFANNGKIVFYDMLGKKVKDVELTEKQGLAKINVADLTAGLYFYTFVIDDKTIATKKIVIR
jgi:hypothetical protein